MRRMTDVHTGLGNLSPDIFNNQWTDNEDFNNAVKTFFDDILKDVKDFKELGGFDFSMTLRENGFRILFGLEPTYKHDPYICYCFDSDKDEIYIQKGVANGYYDKYADVTVPKGTVLYHSTPVEPITDELEYQYQIKTTGDLFSGDADEIENMLSDILYRIRQGKVRDGVGWFVKVGV